MIKNLSRETAMSSGPRLVIFREQSREAPVIALGTGKARAAETGLWITSLLRLTFALEFARVACRVRVADGPDAAAEALATPARSNGDVTGE